MILGFTTAGIARAQQVPPPLSIAYEFRSDSPATHLGDVTLRVSGALAESTLIQLPAWYPGRYALYHFAANVQGIEARCNGRPVRAPKLDQQTWVVRCPASIAFTLRVWWNDLNGSQSQIDERHVNLNPGSVFPYVVGHKADPVTVTYRGPDGWRVMNGAVVSPFPAAGPVTQTFPNYDVFIDHPTEISARFSVDTFTVQRTQYRILVHAEDGGSPTAALRASLAASLQRIVQATVAMWGEQPMERYTFLVHFVPGNRGGGDGMEHLTSTQVIIPEAFADTGGMGTAQAYYGRHEVFSHEFFHTWNMKRLRAAELGPWDYTRENYTATLWVGEGITNYYGARVVRRAGLWSPTLYLARTAEAIANLQAMPARLVVSVEDGSRSAWFADRVPLRQQASLSQSTVNYYTKGEVLGLLLDLEVRARSGGAKTLDDVMRLLWTRFWHGATTTYYLQGHGYRDSDVLQALNDVSNSDFGDFFRRYVEGVEEMPYDSTFAKVGLMLTADGGSSRLTVNASAPAAVRRLGEAWAEGR